MILRLSFKYCFFNIIWRNYWRLCWFRLNRWFSFFCRGFWYSGSFRSSRCIFCFFLFSSSIFLFCNFLLFLFLIFRLDWLTPRIVSFFIFSGISSKQLLTLFDCLSHSFSFSWFFLFGAIKELFPFLDSIFHSRSSFDRLGFWSDSLFGHF